MAFRRPNRRRRKATSPRLARYAQRGCPWVRNRATWCMGLCTPLDGLGTCGRIAPHGLRGRTQTAIARIKAKESRDDPV
jgi:hypothetical protein